MKLDDTVLESGEGEAETFRHSVSEVRSFIVNERTYWFRYYHKYEKYGVNGVGHERSFGDGLPSENR